MIPVKKHARTIFSKGVSPENEGEKEREEDKPAPTTKAPIDPSDSEQTRVRVSGEPKKTRERGSSTYRRHPFLVESSRRVAQMKGEGKEAERRQR